MKLTILILAIIISPLFVWTQSLPECDSVFIDCCSFNTFTSNTVTIEVSNYSSNIFSYPGFILFNANMDTMAIETVDYYGIGWEQTHILNVVHPVNLPFEGLLELHTGFYSSLACSFPVSIADTTLTAINKVENQFLKVSPNPVKDILTIAIAVPKSVDKFTIINVNGSIVQKQHNPGTNTINVSNLNPGVYFIMIYKKDGTLNRSTFIKN